MARHKNVSWDCKTNPSVPEMDAHLAVFMDIRGELQQLNRVLTRYDVDSLVRTIQRIDRRVAKRIKIK